MFIDKGKMMTLEAANGRRINVRLEVNPRAKRLILRLDQRRGEAVAVAPNRRELGAAADFARSRIDWIVRQLDRQQETITLTEGAIIPLRGAPCTLTHIGPGRLASLSPAEAPERPQILRLPGAPETLPARALRYLKRAAREDLSQAVAMHAARLGVTPGRLSIRDTRSRWGSCSHDGNLSFCWRLILAEPHILDYVAAHEVAHLVEMNHSPAFWAQVERTYPEWRPARTWLRTHGSSLHAVG